MWAKGAETAVELAWLNQSGSTEPLIPPTLLIACSRLLPEVGEVLAEAVWSDLDPKLVRPNHFGVAEPAFSRFALNFGLLPPYIK